MDLGKKIAVLLLLLTIGISVKMIIDKEEQADTPSVAGQSSSWLYRRAIEIENDSNKPLFEKDVLLTINTKELIRKGKLRPDCNDIRFLDEDNETPLEYQLMRKEDSENIDNYQEDPNSNNEPEKEEDISHGCNSEETKIWIRIPSIGREGKTIYFLYGNDNAPDFQTSWEIE